MPRRAPNKPVGWEERSETHHLSEMPPQQDDGFHFVQPILRARDGRGQQTGAIGVAIVNILIGVCPVLRK
jgi:hypothetical protein